MTRSEPAAAAAQDLSGAACRRPTPPRIVHLDPWLVVVDKPPGWLVHRSAIDRHERRILLQALRERVGRPVYPVHRLDKPTSGLLVFALDADTARLLTRSFAEHRVEKTYLAVVRGYAPEHERVDHPLAERQDRMTDARARPAGPKPALTEIWRLATIERPEPVGRYATARHSLIAARPRHGRKHQIRRHLKHIFHPVLGDTTYGDGRHNRHLREHLGCHRLLLHAGHLRLAHPRTGEVLDWRAAPGDGFGAVLETLGWCLPRDWPEPPAARRDDP